MDLLATVAGTDDHAGFGLGAAVAAAAAVLFATGWVLQHEAVADSTTETGLALRVLVRRPMWVIGQAATVLGTVVQVAALALAPVAVVQPVLAGGLVVALAARAVRSRCVPARVELIGAALTVGGLVVFLLSARPRPGLEERLPGALPVLTVVVVSVLLVVLTTRVGRGAWGALACGGAAGIAGGAAAVLISVAVKIAGQEGLVATLVSPALWGAVLVAVVALYGSQQAYARGSLSWSLPALVLLDPLAAVPVARVLLDERLLPGLAWIWVPAAAVAAVGVVLLGRTGEGCHRPFRRSTARVSTDTQVS